MTETITPAGPSTDPITRRPEPLTAPELFQREGEHVACSANEPLRLAADDYAWLVVDESVDLFLASVDEEGALGPRRHVARIPAGAAFLSLPAEVAGATLIAVGSTGTLLLRMSRSRLRELETESDCADAVSKTVAAWVTALSLASSAGSVPRNYREVSPDSRLAVNPGDHIMPRLDLVWIRTQADVSFVGSMPVPRGTLFPLTSRTWVEVKEAGELESHGPTAWMELSDRWDALRVFENIALHAVVVRLEADKAEETARLERKRVADRRAMEQSVARLASVLSPPEALPPGTPDDDPLLAACRLVGEAAAITIASPPARSSGDPVVAIARASRLRIRRVALRGEWWREDHGPFLAFDATDRRPVAVLPSSRGGYEAVDTTSGSRTQMTAAVAARLDAFATVFYRPLPEKALDGRDVLRFAGFGTARDFRRFLAVGLGGGLLALVVPIATALTFNSIIPGADHVGLAQLVAALVVAGITMAIFQITRDVAILRIEGKVDSQLQAAIWDRVLALPVAFFRSYSAGDLAQRTMAVNAIRELLSNYVVGALTGGMFSLLTLALLFYYDWQLAIVATSLVLVAVGVTVGSAMLQLRDQRPLYAVQGALAGMMFQFVVGISKLRVAGAETRAFAHWSGRFAEQKRLSNRVREIGSWVIAANSVFPLLISIAVFAWIGLRDGATLDIGSFTGFYAALGSFLISALAMSSSLVSVTGVIPIWERARPVLQAEPEAAISKADPGDLSGDIEVSHLSFRYDAAGPPVLNDISLHAAAGEFVAIVGGSGSGKSTLLRLLLGFEAPDAGAVYYDRQDLAGLDLRAVRRQIGVVLQSGQLMPGDIYTNIVGSSDLTIEDAMTAADMAGLTDDIQQMPMGVHTVISEGGSGFSGGQKQRLMIARAVVNRPRILLFDEATSALDNRTQSIVSKSLGSLKATRIVIAHRLSTIIKADRIYVFDKGRVVQTGAYEELMRQDGLFAELARRQL